MEKKHNAFQTQPTPTFDASLHASNQLHFTVVMPYETYTHWLT